MKLLICLLLLTLHTFAQSIGADNNQFAFDLYSKLEDGNLAFSPYGIFSNLALLKTGADGETADQIATTLHISAEETPFLKAFHKHQIGLTSALKEGYQLYIANALFPHNQTNILQPFQQIATEFFDAKLEPLDYHNPTQATEIINRWISDKTQGKIPKLLQQGDIDTATRLVLANAVYFQGEWTFPFDTKATTPAPFYSDDITSASVQMVQQTRSFSYFENEELQCLSLPFKRKGTEQPQLSCILLLPKSDLSALDDSLNAETLSQILSSAEPTLINAQIPKFCITKRLVLNEPLKELGMNDPFTFAADFSKIDGEKDLQLTTVLHETYFSFNESGVTAASATTSHLGLKSVLYPPDKIIPFTADHPFLFLILDTHSKAILFMGRVMNPLADKCNES